jgi:hypothetical protein
MQRFNYSRQALFFIMAVFFFSSCANWSDVSVYDNEGPDTNEPHIENLYSLNIFDDYLSSENWYSENSDCLQVLNDQQYAYSGSAGLKLTWNRQASGCAWTGMGFGWDGWNAKDFSRIVDKAAIQFYARTTGGTIKGLPWAAALEDYTGAQAYIGLGPGVVEGGIITENWTKVTLPLSGFDYEMNDVDLTIIKQFIIQFESEGVIEMDELALVPFTDNSKKRAQILKTSERISLDGNAEESSWKSADKWSLEKGNIQLLCDDDNLYVFAEIIDESPLQNNKTNADIWNGDCLEIALSMNESSSPKRKSLLMSDQHIGISLSTDPKVWNWRTSKPLDDVVVKIRTKGKSCYVEAQIPWISLGAKLKEGPLYQLEMAIDDADASGERKNQSRWNSTYTEGFHLNPSMWGEVVIKSHTLQND